MSYRSSALHLSSHASDHSPEKKYEDTTGIAAFVGLWCVSFCILQAYISEHEDPSTDELFKSAAYLTEAFTGAQLPSTPAVTPGSAARDPPGSYDAHISALNKEDDTHIPGPCSTDSDVHTSAPLTEPQPIRVELGGRITEKSGGELDTLPAFNLAFKTPVPFFEWLEDGGLDALGGSGIGAGHFPHGDADEGVHNQFGHVRNKSTLSTRSGRELRKSFRLERFSQAMTGTSGWEAPGAILSCMFPLCFFLMQS